MHQLAAIRRAAMALALFAVTSAVSAATITVSTTTDVINPNDGLCALREAVIAANTNTASGPAVGECAAGSGTDVINLPAGTYTLTIAPTGPNDATSGDLNVTASVNIVGTGNPTVAGGGGWADGIFDIVSGTVAMSGFTITGGNRTIAASVSGGGGIRTAGPLTLTAMTITGNTTTHTGGAIGAGGGIFALSSAPLVIIDSTLSNNSALLDSPGALYTQGALTMSGSTVSGNHALGGPFAYTGGISVFYNGLAGGVVSFTNTTFVNNTGVANGGPAALDVSGNATFTVTLRNVTIAGNSNPAMGGFRSYGLQPTTTLYDTLIANNSGSNAPNCIAQSSGVINSGGNNLIGNGTGCTITGAVASDQIGTAVTPINPLLGPLANNGGLTQTMALQAGSPALDAGSNATCAATDQRGTARPQGANCDIGAFELAVGGGIAPTITNGPPGNGTVGVPYNFAYTATGSPAPTFSVTSGALPNGLTISAAGVISGTPTATGTFTGVITATNGVLPNATQNFSIVIGAASVAPTITNGPPGNGLIGVPYNFVFTATGSPAPTFSVTSGALPSGLTISAAGMISGTPTATGTFAGVITATNGVLPNATQSFSIVIGSVGVAPTITNGPPGNGLIGVPYNFVFTATGSPAPTFSVTSGALPSGLTISAAGVISGTPTATGTFAGVITATNGVLPNATQSFSIVIGSVGVAPTITNGPPGNGTFGVPYNFAYIVTGSPAPTFSVTSGALPNGLTMSAAGVISGTPTATGTFTGVITATDGVPPNATQSFSIVIGAAVPAQTAANVPTLSEAALALLVLLLAASAGGTLRRRTN